MTTEPQTEKPVGKTSATERDAISSEEFTFWLAPDAIVNPFDVVMVDQVNQQTETVPSKTYGLVTTLEHRTDAASHLSNFVSSNFGELDEEPNTIRQGTTVAFANVMSNTADIYMPVPSDRLIRFADKEGIEEALGIDVMDKNTRIPAGLIKMSNGTSAIAYLDRDFVLGPEAGHVNISGISGLATKTSYAMFLIQSILQSAKNPDAIAVVILNVKGGDLLQIDQHPDQKLPPAQMVMWEDVGIEPRPFKDVHYYVPNGKNGTPNCYLEPSIYTQYAYDLMSAADKLDLLFTNVSDTSNTMESIIGDIMQGLESDAKDWASVNSWKSLLNGPPLFDLKEGKTKGFGDNKVSSVGKFRRQLRRIVDTNQSGIFVEARAKHQRVIGREIANIRGGHTYVVDIAKLKDEEQTLVFGDLIRTVYQLVSEDTEGLRTVKDPIPEKIIFFIDELNKYAPSGGKESPITQQVLEIAERGRSLGVILISAQQFMSAVHSRVTGNSATKILGRTGSSEIMQPDYRFLDQDLKLSLTRLQKGELLISHAVYRQPIKVVFPRPAYKQSK